MKFIDYIDYKLNKNKNFLDLLEVEVGPLYTMASASWMSPRKIKDIDFTHKGLVSDEGLTKTGAIAYRILSSQLGVNELLDEYSYIPPTLERQAEYLINYIIMELFIFACVGSTVKRINANNTGKDRVMGIFPFTNYDNDDLFISLTDSNNKKDKTPDSSYVITCKALNDKSYVKTLANVNPVEEAESKTFEYYNEYQNAVGTNTGSGSLAEVCKAIYTRMKK